MSIEQYFRLTDLSPNPSPEVGGALILDERNRLVGTIFPLPHRGRGNEGERPVNKINFLS